NVGSGLRPGEASRRHALVFALALRTLARRQRNASCLVAPHDRPAISSSTLTCIRRQRVSTGDLMVALTFPDGARREYPTGTTGLDIAKGISPSLAKRTVAMALDGT